MGGMPIVYITDFGRYYDAFTCIMGMKSNGIATYCIMLRPYDLCLYVWLLSSRERTRNCTLPCSVLGIAIS